MTDVYFTTARGLVGLRGDVARTPAQQIAGLRGREGPTATMFFVFDRPGPITMTMAGMTRPLDIAFIGAENRVHEIVNALPGMNAVSGYGWLVVEAPSGWFRANGVVSGAKIWTAAL